MSERLFWMALYLLGGAEVSSAKFQGHLIVAFQPKEHFDAHRRCSRPWRSSKEISKTNPTSWQQWERRSGPNPKEMGSIKGPISGRDQTVVYGVTDRPVWIPQWPLEMFQIARNTLGFCTCSTHCHPLVRHWEQFFASNWELVMALFEKFHSPPRSQVTYFKQGRPW